MSQSSPISIDYDFQPDTLRLLPEGQFDVQMTLRYSADGVLDLEDLLGQLLAGIEAKMGKIQAISPEGREDLKKQIAQNVIANNIHTVSDVLDAFHDDGEPYWDADGQFHVPLCMQGSGCKLDLAPKLDAGGGLNCDALIESLECSYRDVLQDGVTKQTSILSSAQCEVIKAKGPDWLKSKIKEESADKIIEAYDFELQSDGKCWIRSGSLSFCLVNNETGYRGEVLDVAVPTDKTRKEMCQKFASKLCRALREHLQKSSGSDLSFNQVYKYKYRNWKDKAQEWLNDDIRAEEDWGKCFEWTPHLGKEVRTELKTNKNETHGNQIHYFGLLFDDSGCCGIEKKREQITPWMHNLVGGEGILDETKLKQIEPPLAEAMIKTIRDTKYHHPYKPETIKKVVKLKPELEKAAEIFKLNKLALAGAYAEILERDSSIETHKLHDIAMKKFGKDVESFYKNLPCEVSLLEDELVKLGVDQAGIAFVFGKFGVTMPTKIAMRLNIASALWGLVQKPYRNTMINRAAQFGSFWATILQRAKDSSQAELKDDRGKMIIEATLKKLPPNPEEAQNTTWSKLVADAVNDMQPWKKEMFMVYCQTEQDSHLVKAAKKTENTLKDLALPPRERKLVYKVERFFGHFNA
ncbi:MAG: hypothetical protein KJ720_11050 [Proteobacteria bacterium]|nr:hypothetical protein [Pseudomonadota bacterium]MBU2517259.1 hypothetical protein [Pseudomonadota bacterium]